MMSVDFGYWTLPDGRRALLCWNPHNGQLILHHPDGLRNDLVAVVVSEPDLRKRIDGWADHAGTREGLGWLAQRMSGCR
jgi:hypothetical protein